MITSEIYKVIFEASPDAVVVTDTKGEIILVNKQVGEIFGYTENELIGQNISVLIPQDLHVEVKEYEFDQLVEALGRIHSKLQDNRTAVYNSAAKLEK